MTALNETNARWLGRTFVREDGKTQVSWTASGFELRFRGTGLDAELDADIIGEAPRIQVYVDGIPQGGRIPVAGAAWVPLARALAPGEHTVRVVKLTEALQSSPLVGGVRVYGGELLSPPAAKARKIEFIGDSITCGHTIERGPEDEDVWSIDTQNGMLTYAAVCAENLDADFSCFSLSGWTVYRRVDMEGGDDCAVPPVYGQTAPVNGNAAPWDFSRFQPGAVVVALGTNDSSYIVQGAAEAAVFARKYREFLEQLRGLYPKAAIVCTVGMMNPTAFAYIRQAVQELGDGNIFALQEQFCRSTHPIVADHRQAGDALSAFIAQITGWHAPA